MKIKNILYFLIIPIIISILLIITFYVKYRGNNNQTQENSSDEEVVEQKISEETYARLIAESQNEENKTKALNHINNDWRYTIQDEIEYEGKIYKSYYIRYSDYVDGSGDFVKKEIYYMPEYREIIEECMNDENIYHYGDDEGKTSGYNSDPGYRLAQEKMKVITMERYKEFKFMEEWIVAALTICDKEGNVEDVKVFGGAVGTDLKNRDGKLVWEVFISDRLDAYICRGEQVGFWGQVSGTVYDMVIDSNNDISDIMYVRNSCDNDVFDLFEKGHENTVPYLIRKIYVENQDLSIQDIINVKEKVLDNSFRSVLGHEHTNIDGKPDLPIYFTKEGYVVLIAGKKIHYCKYPREDFLDIYFWDRGDVGFEDMFIDDELNPKLQKELDDMK